MNGITKTICAALACALLALPCPRVEAAGDIDLDLTSMSSTMLYGAVFDIVSNVKKYEGMTVKMAGQLAVYRDDESDDVFFACVIADATACCAQGLEFVPSDASYSKGIVDGSAPEWFREDGDIVVTGTFSAYTGADGLRYPCLVNAEAAPMSDKE